MKDFFRGRGGWITFTYFSGRTEGGGGQSSPTEYREGLKKIDCRLTANKGAS